MERMSPEMTPEQIATQYDETARAYNDGKAAFFGHLLDEGAQFIRNNLPDLALRRVLDVGCGAGSDMLHYHLSRGASEVYGIDSSRVMIEEAKRLIDERRLGTWVKVKLSGVEEIPYEDDYFDVVTSRFALQHVSDLDVAYREIGRVMRPGAVLLYATHHPLLDLFRQEEQVYGKREVVKVTLFDNRVPIFSPSHTLADYFSPTFFKLFTLDNFFESQNVEQQDVNDFNMPGTMGVKAIRRAN